MEQTHDSPAYTASHLSALLRQEVLFLPARTKGWLLAGDGMAELERREIGDEEHVSQYGSRLTGQPNFWDHPRAQDTDGLSVILGRATPAEARRPVRTVGVPTSDDGVRYARVGDLRARGFVVTHTPNRRNRLHTSISCPGKWDNLAIDRFNECFGDPIWHEESREETGE
jgi:hypothetical protein